MEKEKKTDTKRLYDIERAVDSTKKEVERLYTVLDELKVGLVVTDNRGLLTTLNDRTKNNSTKLTSLSYWQLATCCGALVSAIFAIGIFVIEVGWL